VRLAVRRPVPRTRLLIRPGRLQSFAKLGSALPDLERWMAWPCSVRC